MRKENYRILQDLDEAYENTDVLSERVSIADARSRVIIADAFNSIALSLHNIEQKTKSFGNKSYNKNHNTREVKTEREDTASKHYTEQILKDELVY